MLLEKLLATTIARLPLLGYFMFFQPVLQPNSEQM